MNTLKDIEDTQAQLRNGETGQAVNEAFMACLGWERRLTEKGERLERNGHPSLINDPRYTRLFDKDGVQKININPTTNTDDALEEVARLMNYERVLVELTYGYFWEIDDLPVESVKIDSRYEGKAPTLAAAICIAILEYMKGQCDG